MCVGVKGALICGCDQGEGVGNLSLFGVCDY
jgi:hypothetical protein